MCQHTIIRDTLVDQILNCTTPEESNKAMLDFLLVIVKTDSDLLWFCKALEAILGDMPTVLGSLRIG